YLYIIFAAIFFVSLGIIADLRYLTQDMILFIAILTVVAVITKVIGCGLPSKLMGMSWRDSALIGFGMTPRGEVAMIVGLIALNRFQEMAASAVNPAEAELLLQLGNELFIAIVVISLVTTVIVPLIYKGFFFRGEKTKSVACEQDPQA
ncbi:MAG TPA: cation:proton antiporter, partial [Methanocorpusculum sp.]|nr:cation:proton antiporter [Methanocorpusculum sp.]